MWVVIGIYFRYRYNMTVVQDNYNYIIHNILCECDELFFILNVQILLCMIFFVLLFLYNIYVPYVVIKRVLLHGIYFFFHEKK